MTLMARRASIMYDYTLNTSSGRYLHIYTYNAYKYTLALQRTVAGAHCCKEEKTKYLPSSPPPGTLTTLTPWQVTG